MMDKYAVDDQQDKVESQAVSLTKTANISIDRARERVAGIIDKDRRPSVIR